MEYGILYTRVRVLHAACFVPEVDVLVGNRPLAEALEYGAASAYQRVTEGFRRVSVICRETGEQIAAETIPFYGGRRITLVVCNTMNSVVLVVMDETGCNPGRRKGCLRIANFSFGEGPFDIIDAQRKEVFADIAPREITMFFPAGTGKYDFSIVRTGSRYQCEDQEKNTDERRVYSLEGQLEELNSTDVKNKAEIVKNTDREGKEESVKSADREDMEESVKSADREGKEESVKSAEPEDELAFFLYVLPGKQYTACILGACDSQQPLQVKILEF